MPPSIQVAVDRFQNECQSTLDWLGATEALWITAPPTTEVRKRLKTPQMEALYEAAYLRIFTAWEVVLEDLTIRMMARAKTGSWVPRAPAGGQLYSTILSARQALYSGRDYLLWHNPTTVTRRVSGVLDTSPLETEILNAATWLEHLGSVRHRIAHSSDDATRKFEVAALALTGTTYRGSPGRLLRAQDISDPLNSVRWIARFDSKLRSVVSTIVA